MTGPSDSSPPPDPWKTPSDDNPFASPDLQGFSRFGSDLALHRTARGLQFVLIGAVLSVILAFALSAFLISLDPDQDQEALNRYVPWFLRGLLLTAALGFIGRLHCLGIPREAGARPLIFGAVGCDLLAIFISLLAYAEIIKPEAEEYNRLLALASALLFILFLKRMAEFIGDQALADLARSILQATFALFGAVVVLALTLAAPLLTLIVGIIVLGLALTIFIRYLKLLSRLRSSILDYLQKREM